MIGSQAIKNHLSKNKSNIPDKKVYLTHMKKISDTAPTESMNNTLKLLMNCCCFSRSLLWPFFTIEVLMIVVIQGSEYMVPLSSYMRCFLWCLVNPHSFNTSSMWLLNLNTFTEKSQKSFKLQMSQHEYVIFSTESLPQVPPVQPPWIQAFPFSQSPK